MTGTSTAKALWESSCKCVPADTQVWTLENNLPLTCCSGTIAGECPIQTFETGPSICGTITCSGGGSPIVDCASVTFNNYDCKKRCWRSHTIADIAATEPPIVAPQTGSAVSRPCRTYLTAGGWCPTPVAGLSAPTPTISAGSKVEILKALDGVINCFVSCNGLCTPSTGGGGPCNNIVFALNFCGLCTTPPACPGCQLVTVTVNGNTFYSCFDPTIPGACAIGCQTNPNCSPIGSANTIIFSTCPCGAPTCAPGSTLISVTDINSIVYYACVFSPLSFVLLNTVNPACPAAPTSPSVNPAFEPDLLVDTSVLLYAFNKCGFCNNYFDSNGDPIHSAAQFLRALLAGEDLLFDCTSPVNTGACGCLCANESAVAINLCNFPCLASRLICTNKLNQVLGTYINCNRPSNCFGGCITGTV